jgi:hypothetical protein
MKLSIVIEWDTVLEGKESRGAACLAALRAELETMDSAETIICFDRTESSEESVRRAIGQHWPGALIVAPVAPDVDYYEKKNYGFGLSRGEIVVFLDSDLIPEKSWLVNLLTPFRDFRRSVVVGRTHLETSTIYERGVALFWIFDTREQAAVRPTGRLVSNNIAFRRNIFKHFPFPKRPTFRGQCSELAAILQSRGIALYEQPAARAAHPAPDGVRRFFQRAWSAGRDQAYYDRLEREEGMARSLQTFRADLARVRKRIMKRGPLLEATISDRFAAITLGAAYYAAKLFGYWSLNLIPRVHAPAPVMQRE